MHLRRDFLRSVEAGVIGLFLIQAIRFLYGTLYAHVSSADLVGRVANTSPLRDLPGYITPAEVQREIAAVGIALLSPLLALILARTRWSIPLAVAFCVVGRSLALQVPDSAPLAAALVVGAGVLYLALIIIRRPAHFPSMLLIGFTLDQLIRAAYDSRDVTWLPDFEIAIFGQNVTMEALYLGAAVGMLLLSGYTTFIEIEVTRLPGYEPEKRGRLTGWGSLAFGSFMFLELTLLGLANAVARWSEVSYATAVPWMLLATAAPLIPFIRDQARNFLGSFDGTWRGWIWALLLGFLLVIGNRFDGPLAFVVLVVAQFITGLTLWWMVLLRDEDSLTNPTPILLLLSLVMFGLFSTGDYFTYDYAFVRDFAAPFQQLGDVLRAFREMGLQLFLFAAIILAMPLILERRVIPWRGGRTGESFLSFLLVIGLTVGGSQISATPAVVRPDNVDCLRFASLNIHSGYTLLFDENLELVKQAILRNGADVVLLQEVDTGRMSSYGVDQAEWLARELGMEAAYFPQDESLRGLAILSRIPLKNVEGEKLTSENAQAGVMHVELELDTAPFHVYNIWLGYRTTDANGQPLPDSLQDQNRQTEEMQEIIAANHGPAFAERIVLGGTFNYDMDSPLYQKWANTTFVDPFVGLAEERLDTVFLVNGVAARFDYLWLMNLTPAGVGIDQDLVASDHRLSVVQVSRAAGLQCR